MRGGLKTLQRLAAVGSLSEFCQVADRKSLIEELNLVHDPSQRRYLQRLNFTTVLTAALVRGLAVVRGLVVNWWGTCIRDDVLESRRLAVAHINSGEDIDCHKMFGKCLLETHDEY